MAEKIVVAGTVEGKGYDTNLEYNRRVYATEGIAPACKGTGGGGHETKIIERRGGLMVKEATKTGYSMAEPGDSINLAFPNSETRRGRVGKGRAHTLQAGEPEQVVVEPSICAMRGRNPDNPSDRTRGIPLEQRLEIGGGVSNTLTSVQKDNLVAEPTRYDFRIRKLTPRECFRLMDFDDADFDRAKAAGVSETQLYKQAGNSIVVAVLEAIFREML